MNSQLSISQMHHPDHPTRKWMTMYSVKFIPSVSYNFSSLTVTQNKQPALYSRDVNEQGHVFPTITTRILQ
jgi:hypothetical protein